MLYKKDFKAIAEIILNRKPIFVTMREDIGKTTACRHIANDIADYLATKNPNFDRQKFLNACGL